jgi:hypothetical protein
VTTMDIVRYGVLAVLAAIPLAAWAVHQARLPDAPPHTGWTPDETDKDGNVIVRGDLADDRDFMNARRAERAEAPAPDHYEDPPNRHCRCGYAALAVAVYPDGHREMLHILRTMGTCVLEPAVAP